VITRPVEAKVLSPEAKDRFWARWNAQYTGTANAAKTALLEEGMDIKQMSYTAKDAQYVEAKKFNLEEVARMWHIPPQDIGIMDNANYSNIVAINQNRYQGTLGPDLTSLKEELELQLLHEYPNSDDVYMEFNVREMLRGTPIDEAKAIQTSTGRPVLTANEGRALINRPRITDDPTADELIVPMNVTVGGQASPSDSGDQNRNDETNPDRPPALEE
jgi:HK97 family phage portal protein